MCLLHCPMLQFSSLHCTVTVVLIWCEGVVSVDMICEKLQFALLTHRLNSCPALDQHRLNSSCFDIFLTRLNPGFRYNWSMIWIAFAAIPYRRLSLYAAGPLHLYLPFKTQVSYSPKANISLTANSILRNTHSNPFNCYGSRRYSIVHSNLANWTNCCWSDSEHDLMLWHCQQTA